MRIEVKKNAKKNIVFGFVNKIVLMILPFVVRSYIYGVLGPEYLGLNSLFTAVIQVLSLTELGFGSVLVFHMYRPIAENDQKTLNALLKVYKSAYFCIGMIMITIGVIITPFIPYIIKGSCPANVNIYIVFWIHVFNTSISYFGFAYKQSLLVAYQREDINSITNLVLQLLLQFTQIAVLVLSQNYYLYVLCMPIFTIINNIWINSITKKMFPTANPVGYLEKGVIYEIRKLVVGTFVQKSCMITRNSLDSICISAFVGLTYTAIYNNYYTIMNGITLILGIISSSLAGGIGNHVILKTKEENFEELKELDFLYMGISGICTAVLLCTYQTFMKIWMGDTMLLPLNSVVLLCLYFYLLKMGDMKYLYNAANGLWWKLKGRALVETVANVVLNIVLGKIWGINGIIIATIVSLFFVNFIWGSILLFKEYFDRVQLKVYFGYHLKFLFVNAVISILSFVVINKIVRVDKEIVELFMKGSLAALFSAILYVMVFSRTKGFNRVLGLFDYYKH